MRSSITFSLQFLLVFACREAFITADIYNGDFGGLVGADALCQSLAAGAGLSHSSSFRAWLSSSTENANEHILVGGGDGCWQRVDGLLVATALDLSDGVVENPITVTQFNESKVTPPGGALVFTGTDHNGQRKYANIWMCKSDWTRNSSNNGLVGLYTNDAKWTAAGSRICSLKLPIYCFSNYVPPPTPEPTGPSPAPTASPTASPVTMPPSVSPTTHPTPQPSLSPSANPTTSPVTQQPSASPTMHPSPLPSTSPTAQPSPSPVTLQPSLSPSLAPSDAPSLSPTQMPTPSPDTPLPTPAPSQSPSNSPSSSPTRSPTAVPEATTAIATTSLSPTASSSSSPNASMLWIIIVVVLGAFLCCFSAFIIFFVAFKRFRGGRDNSSVVSQRRASFQQRGSRSMQSSSSRRSERVLSSSAQYRRSRETFVAPRFSFHNPLQSNAGYSEWPAFVSSTTVTSGGSEYQHLPISQQAYATPASSGYFRRVDPDNGYVEIPQQSVAFGYDLLKPVT